MNKLLATPRAALVAAALCGCAAPLLKERREPFTRLVISNASPLPLTAVAYRDEANCTAARRAPFKGRGAVLDMPVQPWETVAFSFTDDRHATVSTCSGIGSFRADDAHEYLVDIEESDGACAMRVSRRPLGSSDSPTPVDLEPRKLRDEPRAGRGPQCEMDARFAAQASS